ncbi:uncharacterized protein LOC109597478 isoform X3 [Aethina tumida]|nr:uncharacterized protein LOC109597478 isoform X3 [Aethina tumida]
MNQSQDTMDQSRPENSFHYHMHHVCTCQGGGSPCAAVHSIFPQPQYYPHPVGYRPPVPHLMPFPPAAPRPYLQHYQYTQFNVGGQYPVPMAVPQGVYGNVTQSHVAVSQSGAAEMMLAAAQRDRRDAQEEDEVTPPANELLLPDNCEETINENFVKFLERSCLTAEQIAYRNRNRPCFRNIQNLCIRTRSEILKPCTTVSNIHSQGIPWATKDFIYAFVRLTNCWHILKGYWENRDGSSLGKIEKELTPEFRACYLRWEKETIDLSAQLTRIFYNLDTNLNSSSTMGVNGNNTPPQEGMHVNILKSPGSEMAFKKPGDSETATTSPVTSNNSIKNVRGILHLPSLPSETIDQVKGFGDFCKEEEFCSEEDDRRLYMKPGSYYIPKKPNENHSPRAIEFLGTAQNINKANNVNEKYWINVGNRKSVPNMEPNQDEFDKQDATEQELNLSSHINVHEWLTNNNFTQFGTDVGSQTQRQEMCPFFLDPGVQFEGMAPPPMDAEPKCQITVLQRNPAVSGNGITPIHARKFKKRKEVVIEPQRCCTVYENENGITDISTAILEKIVIDIMDVFLSDGLFAQTKVCSEFSPLADMDMILKKVRGHDYIYVNEVVRDLRYVIHYSAYLYKHVDNKEAILNHKLDMLLKDNIPDADFQDIKGDLKEVVGPIRLRLNYDPDGDYV